MDCGRDDELLPEFRKMEAILRARDIDFEAHIFPGDHGWKYLHAHYVNSLRFCDARWKEMASAPMKISPPRSLRRFIVLWSGAIGIAFLLLALDAGVTLRRVNSMARDEVRQGAHLQRVQEFEVAALEANRRPRADWGRSDRALRQLRNDGSSAVDLTPIESAYQNLKVEFDPRAPASDERPFLDAMRGLRRADFARVQERVERSTRLDGVSRSLIVALLVLALGGVLAGGIELWTRVFGPLLKVSGAAKRFGAGDLSARVTVERDDEIGALATTWNSMARSIEAREAERLRFVAAVAHDLKNPLLVVGGVAAMMRDKPDKFTPAERAEWLNKIARNAARMEAMIADLTNAVQAQTGALQLYFGPCDLSALVRECAEEITLSFPRHRVICHGPDALELRADKARLERAIANLLSNAAKYSAADTEVTARWQTRGDTAMLEVCDQGAGIAPEDLKRLFTPFVRLERTEKMASGTGLGLATTRVIIEAHGGRLEVESQVGVGSTFRIVLPLAGLCETPHSNTVSRRGDE